MFFWETAFFYIFALGALISSGAVVALRNPLYSAIALILDFFFFAGLYVLLSAHFMAIIQILVYGGAIMVLFMFIIMLLNLKDEEIEQPVIRASYIAGFAVCLALFTFVLSALLPLTNSERINAQRDAAVAEYQERVEDAEEGEEVVPPRIATPSGVPGLFTDLNEDALETLYEGQVRSMERGTTTPAHGKYRPAEGATFELPPVLRSEDSMGRPQPVSFGTVEPISLLLVNRNVVPFELTAILLLAAIMGAVIIAKKRL